MAAPTRLASVPGRFLWSAPRERQEKKRVKSPAQRLKRPMADVRLAGVTKNSGAAGLKRPGAIPGLDARLDGKPSQLPGARRQRVAWGRAFGAQTQVCLMDEPLSNLDAQLRVEMRREIRSLQQRLGMTMLYVTHDQVEAMTLADQVVLMRNGRIEQDPAPPALYERPPPIFAAPLVGPPPTTTLPPSLLPAH